jgi:hypothetical protein
MYCEEEGEANHFTGIAATAVFKRLPEPLSVRASELRFWVFRRISDAGGYSRRFFWRDIQTLI